MNRHTQEAAVKAVESAYDTAWNDGDVEAIVSYLTPDVVMVNPRGGVATGHEQVRRHLQELFAGEFATSRHTSRIVRVSFVSSDVAVVDGVALIESDDSSAPERHAFTDVLVRRNDGWLVAHVRAYSATPYA
ncbi:MAG TPA: SgcJ/EcaC family oxidoreductase [Actinomycetota bacterium]|nr:SgcJ/EcaC family oxidoreductase [Actinomycetota bacterium]